MPRKTLGLLPWAGTLCLFAWAGSRPALAQSHPAMAAAVEIQQKMPLRIEYGEPITIDMLVSNSGSARADNVVVRDTLPLDHELLEANPLPERFKGTLTWKLGRLEPGEQRSLRLRVLLKVGSVQSEFRHPVTVTFENIVNSSCVAEVLRPKLTMDLQHPDAANLSEPVSMVLTIKNVGTGPARNILVHAPLPTGLTHPSGSDLENTINVIEAGQSRTIALGLTPTQSGDIRGQIRVDAKGVDQVTREYRLRVRDVRLALVTSDQSLSSPDGTYTFGWSIANQGGETAQQVKLAVHLPEGFAFIRAGEQGVYDPQTHSVTWSIPELRAGDKRGVDLIGVPRKSGDLECKVLLWAGKHLQQQQRENWSVKLSKAPAAPTE